MVKELKRTWKPHSVGPEESVTPIIESMIQVHVKFRKHMPVDFMYIRWERKNKSDTSH